MVKKYYEAYDDRYKKIHTETSLAWAGDRPSPSIENLLNKYGATKKSKILEIGCGEGQNAINLISLGYNIEASDISAEAIKWCKQKAKEKGIDENHFYVMDILKNNLKMKYDFIYSVAVLHMLVDDKDRHKFLKFVHNHLTDEGKAFIIVMGDGKETRRSDISKAFELAERPFADKVVRVATTSCRIVTWDEYLNEMKSAHLNVLEHYIDTTISGFSSSMVVVVEKL